MKIEIVDRRHVARPTAQEMAILLCRVFPKPGRTVESRTADIVDGWKNDLGTEPQRPRSFIVRDGSRVIAHAEISPRIIGTQLDDMTIGALAGVCTAPEVRGQGLGALLVRSAFQLVDDGTFTFSLFQNSKGNQPFYEKLGAKKIENCIVNSMAESPRKNPFWAEVAMVYPATKPWPDGEIDLRGPGY
jgi:predicted N-acetyltransferase YhbS